MAGFSTFAATGSSPARFGNRRARKNPRVLTLYQAEWCPHSSRVRQRLTELGVDYHARQVPAEPEEREDMRRAIDTDEIPVLVTDEGEKLVGEDDILGYLSDNYEERTDAERHREKSIEEADARDPRKQT